MKHTHIRAKDCLLYGLICFGSNLLASIFVSLILKIFVMPMKRNALMFILTYVILFVGAFGVSLAISFYFLKNRVPTHYQPSDEKRLWLKNGIRFILPAEIFRFLLCLFCLGSLNSFGLLSLIPTFLFEQTYMIRSGRYGAIRQDLNFIFGDYLAYAVCYFLYIAVYLFAVLAIYRYLWNVGKRERDELIVRDSKPRFY